MLKKKSFREVPVIIVESPAQSLSSIDGNNDLVLCGQKNLMRRNSLSLPNFKIASNEQLKASENGIRSDSYNSENEFSDVEEYNSGQRIEVPLRNARRKSITVSPRMLKVIDDETGSPQNSITSINSLASLLREKMQMLPTTIKKKKPKDYKLRAFVGFLFLTVVFLVVLAYVLYHQKVLQRAYFEKIKFNKVDRIMKIYNSDGVDVIRARLGTTLNYDKVFPCLEKDEKDDGSICLEWLDRARLYLQYAELHPEIHCYNLLWISLSNNIEPTDCIDMSWANWYGGGQTAESAWPLEKGNHDFAPFVTGRVDKHQWGNVLKRYFINSKGAAIVVDKKTPLYISIAENDGHKELCLRAKFDDFAFVNRITHHPYLNYSICTGKSMMNTHSFMMEKSLWDGLKEIDNNNINYLLSEPLWQITSNSKEDFTEETITNYTTNVLNLGFQQGHVLINEFWQKQVGDFTVDKDRFPSLEDAINILHRRGFSVVFSIQPFISTESSNFAETVKKRLLISERFSDRRIPALTRYKSLESAGMLDVTHNKTIPWLLDKLKLLKDTYKFDSYFLDVGLAYNMPHYYQCERTLRNPDQYKSIFISSLRASTNLFGVNSAVQRPQAPTFVSLPMVESSWDGLRQVIPTILTYGLVGYPFLIPGAVGGDYERAGTNFTTTVRSNILLPDKELYIRWLQLATFLPVIRFTHLPNTYGDDKLLEMAKLLINLRAVTVTPLLKKYANEALDSGIPLIRPLWMLDPNDQACHVVTDEFAIGNDLIVAPVLYSGEREREVYLPAGVWKDGIDGSFRKGSRWIHDYKVEENQVAFFEKMPNNTRF